MIRLRNPMDCTTRLTLADIVHEHLQADAPWSTQYRQRCPGCVNAACRGVPSRVAAPATAACPIASDTAAAR